LLVQASAAASNRIAPERLSAHARRTDGVCARRWELKLVVQRMIAARTEFLVIFVFVLTFGCVSRCTDPLTVRHLSIRQDQNRALNSRLIWTKAKPA
jgi:hypothetical protein